MKTNYRINEEITAEKVRVTKDGAAVGIMPLQDALNLAEDQDLDLIEIAPNAIPPVCILATWDKFKYEQEKKEKQSRKSQHITEIKEIRMSPNIDSNDMQVKANSAVKFLKNGDRVKVTIRFRGREIAYANSGNDLLLKFADLCSKTGYIDKQPKLEGKFMSMFLAAKKE